MRESPWAGRIAPCPAAVRRPASRERPSAPQRLPEAPVGEPERRLAVTRVEHRQRVRPQAAYHLEGRASVSLCRGSASRLVPGLRRVQASVPSRDVRAVSSE